MACFIGPRASLSYVAPGLRNAGAGEWGPTAKAQAALPGRLANTIHVVIVVSITSLVGSLVHEAGRQAASSPVQQSETCTAVQLDQWTGPEVTGAERSPRPVRFPKRLPAFLFPYFPKFHVSQKGHAWMPAHGGMAAMTWPPIDANPAGPVSVRSGPVSCPPSSFLPFFP